jgi:hypothetical protein
MGLFNTTNADTPKKDTSREKQTVEMELFLTVMHDGGYKAQGQKIQRDLYRSGRSVNLRDEEEVGISFEGIDNPKVSPSPNSMVENELVHHDMIMVDMLTDFGYKARVVRVRNRIDEKAREYYDKPNVSKLTVHLFVYFYAQGNPVSNLFGDMKPKNESDAQAQIKAVFSRPLFTSSKVKYNGVEFFGSFDVDTDAIFNDGTKESIERNTPSGEDIADAAVLCQFTYDTQKVEDQSWIDATVDKLRSLFSKSKNASVKNANNIVSYENVSTQWRMLTSKEVGDLTNNNEQFKLKSSASGFYSQVFYKPASTGKDFGKFAYCTAGTNPLSPADWFSNLAQGLIDWAPQYVQSERNAIILDKSLSSKFLLFVGHSLGGGLASRNALATQSRHAVTFNAAGLCVFRTASKWLVDKVGDFFHENKTTENKRVHPFLIKGEILHVVLRLIGEMPYGFDKKQPSYVNDSDPMYTRVTNTVGRHGVANFIIDAKVREQLLEYKIQS